MLCDQFSFMPQILTRLAASRLIVKVLDFEEDSLLCCCAVELSRDWGAKELVRWPFECLSVKREWDRLQ